MLWGIMLVVEMLRVCFWCLSVGGILLSGRCVGRSVKLDVFWAWF